MSLQKQQNFLARLYTDENLRRAFLLEPQKTGREYDLTAKEIAEIAEVMPDELNFFADSLFWKRLREVENFLPLTKEIAGAEFTGEFRRFSQTFNPQSIRKHLEDAFEFAGFLQTSENVSELAKNAARFERAKLAFFGYGKKFVVCRLEFDLREISRSPAAAQSGEFKKRRNFAVWIRVGNKTRHFNF